MNNHRERSTKFYKQSRSIKSLHNQSISINSITNPGCSNLYELPSAASVLVSVSSFNYSC